VRPKIHHQCFPSNLMKLSATSGWAGSSSITSAARQPEWLQAETPNDQLGRFAVRAAEQTCQQNSSGGFFAARHLPKTPLQLPLWQDKFAANFDSESQQIGLFGPARVFVPHAPRVDQGFVQRNETVPRFRLERLATPVQQAGARIGH
jgi:hypothetical protein